MVSRCNGLSLSKLGAAFIACAMVVVSRVSLAEAPLPEKAPVMALVGVAVTSPKLSAKLAVRPVAKAVTPPNSAEKSKPTVTKPSLVALIMDSSVRQGEVLFVAVKVPIPKEGALKTPAIVPHHVHWNGGGGADIALYSRGAGVWDTVVPVRVDHPVGAGGLTVMDAKNNPLASHSVLVASGGYARQNITLSGGMGSLTPEPGEMEAIGKLKTDTNPAERLWQKQFSLPVPECMNSPFGNLRYHNGKFTGNFHKGIDQRSPQGRVVKAPTDGVVKIAKTYRLHGGTVGLDHGQGLSSVYIHLSKISVKPGQLVKAGDILGQVGATGFATGPHLHWGLFVHGVPVNPTQWVHPDVC